MASYRLAMGSGYILWVFTNPNNYRLDSRARENIVPIGCTFVNWSRVVFRDEGRSYLEYAV